MPIKLVTDTPIDGHHRRIYRNSPGLAARQQASRYTAFCMWAEANDFNPIEYLLPQIIVPTETTPFLYETRFAGSDILPPTPAEIASLGPWHYQLEFGPVSTRNRRDELDWHIHRYRANALVDLAAEIAGGQRTDLSVLDVASHCGVFSLQFAEHGFGSVTGLDLRNENLAQARFLADAYRIDGVRFEQGNVRNLGMREQADIVFCGGLLYHVTFPMELLTDLFETTKEFLILDTLCQKHPFSGFHLICSKDIGYTAEGETHFEFMPTYRGVIDGLFAVGFTEVYEILGSGAKDTRLYKDGNLRSFLAVKNKDGIFRKWASRIDQSSAAIMSA